MIENFKNNTKIKLISLLSSIVLWMYVMAIVDPEETKLFEGIPVSINNLNVLKEKDLIIYPEIEMTTDISISGKLSKLQKVTKDNIHVDGEIKNPIEGNNDIYLRGSAPGQVTHEFRNNIMIVNLEKVVSNQKNIEIQPQGKSKINIDKITINKGIDAIVVSGPRSQVQQVKKVVGIVDVGNKMSDFSEQITLIPMDEDGNEVEDVELEQKSVTVNVELLKEKKVPIKINLDDNTDTKLTDYTLSQQNITIKGKKDKIDKIEYIETQLINIKEVNSTSYKDIELNIPEGISSDIRYISIKLNTPKLIKESFVYTKQEVQIKNGDKDIDLSTISIPENINVNIEYLDSVGAITKSDIVLYIDLSQEINEEDKYEIKYDTKYELKNILINPDKSL